MSLFLLTHGWHGGYTSAWSSDTHSLCDKAFSIPYHLLQLLSSSPPIITTVAGYLQSPAQPRVTSPPILMTPAPITRALGQRTADFMCSSASAKQININKCYQEQSSPGALVPSVQPGTELGAQTRACETSGDVPISINHQTLDHTVTSLAPQSCWELAFPTRFTLYCPRSVNMKVEPSPIGKITLHLSALHLTYVHISHCLGWPQQDINTIGVLGRPQSHLTLIYLATSC